MTDGLSPEKTELLLRLENTLYYLKMKSSYFPDWDKGEEVRLEQMRSELLRESEALSRQAMSVNQRASTGP